jgi:type II secretory pathway component GspD/PulD (secretin)
VANRSTIILGGLISESKNVQDQGIPILKDIPLIGYAAKNASVAKSRSELMIFIQPIVVRSDEEATFTSYDEDVRSEIGEDAAATFPEPGHPPIMHRAEEISDIEDEGQPLKRLGQKIFGKQKGARAPIP